MKLSILATKEEINTYRIELDCQFDKCIASRKRREMKINMNNSMVY